MDFDRDGFEATTETIALAVTCGQTPIGEMNGGPFVLAYSRDGDAEALPGQAPVAFTMIDVQNGLRGDLATNVTVAQILTSGQIYGRNGLLKEQLATAIDERAGKSGCLDDLRGINPINPQVTRSQVGDVNQFLITRLAQSDEWTKAFIDRANILRNISATSDNSFVYGAVQKLNDYVLLARDVCKKNSIARINENSQSR